jgi:hypothetical protein
VVKVVDFKPLAFHRCRFESYQELWSLCIAYLQQVRWLWPLYLVWSWLHPMLAKNHLFCFGALLPKLCWRRRKPNKQTLSLHHSSCLYYIGIDFNRQQASGPDDSVKPVRKFSWCCQTTENRKTCSVRIPTWCHGVQVSKRSFSISVFIVLILGGYILGKCILFEN